MTIETVLVTMGCSLIVIWVVTTALRAVISILWFTVGLAAYFFIWLFMPRTWEEMHRD